MNIIFHRICSLVLVLVMLLQIAPVRSLGTEIHREHDDTEAVTQTLPTVSNSSGDAYILDELTERRTEFTKEFLMSNGLHMAAVYDNAVHYQENGQWQEIDNTLKLSAGRVGNVYTNTAGNWHVLFPQNLTPDSGISITKDEYVLSFRMSGELRKATGGNELMSSSGLTLNADTDADSILNTIGTEETLSLSRPAADSPAAVIPRDTQTLLAEAEYPETVADKIYSRLEYGDVYTNTDVIFELSSNLVKESIVMEQFDASLRGYTYLLDTGEMTPVLSESGEILLMDEASKEPVMVMPAPYLVDNAGKYCYDVEVKLASSGDEYILSYLLPQRWLADNSRTWPVILDPEVMTSL